MQTDVNKPATLAKNARSVAQEPIEIVHVRMSECREDCVKGCVRKREIAHVRLNKLNRLAEAPPRKPELVFGEVDAGHRPPKIKERHRMEAGAAAEIEAVAASRPEQTPECLGRSEPEGSDVLVVPVGIAVVQRTRHLLDDATAVSPMARAASVRAEAAP
jgi:hypothetical protein